jgi:Cu+-exporting ATPase
MGTGTDIAIDASDMTLVKGDLRGVLRARKLSRATMKNALRLRKFRSAEP